VRLTVTDDGTGMPADAVDAAGMGLKIMQYRARILGGEVRFESVEPQGTRIVCECPLEPLAQPARAPRARRRSRLSTATG
jgi:signal transduction histidine kinase